MSDRTVLRLLKLAVLLLLVAGCTESLTLTTSTTTTTTSTTTTTTTIPTTTTTTLPPPDVYGGRVIIGLAAEPRTLNPLLASSDDHTARLIAQVWSAGVQDISDNGALIPEIVVELPTVANGGVVINGDGTMTVTYQIREQAQWSDGVPITGADFQFTLEMILDPSIPISRGTYADVVSSEVGDKTFSYTLAVPTISYEGLFDVLIPAHAVSASTFATAWGDRTWLSAGPFVFHDQEPGQSITFRRNDSYWKEDAETGARLPYLDEVEFRFIPDDTERLNAFRRRDIDVMEGSSAMPTALQAWTLEFEGAAVDTAGGPVWVHVNFQFGPNNRNPDTLNTYVSYRQAIMHAIDRQRIVDELFDGRLAPLDSYVTAFNGALSQGSWSQYSFDPELSRMLLAQAVADRDADGNSSEDPKILFSVNAENADRTRVAELVSEMLDTVGISYVAAYEDPLVFFGETVSGGRWDGAMWAWQASSGHSGLVRFHDVLDPADSQALTNFYRWGTSDSAIQDASSRRYADLLVVMRRSVDHDELTMLIQEAEQIIADEALFLPLYAEPLIAAYWPRAIEQFVMNTTSAGFTWNIEHWRVPTSAD